MDQVLINNWNKRAKQNDDIYIAGDLIFGNGLEANDLLNQLNGRKHLIIGNRDHRFLDDKRFDKSLFSSINDYLAITTTIKGYKTKVVIFHYPIANWDGSHYGSIHCYGHIHNNTPNFELLGQAKNKFMFNVSSDANSFNLHTVEELLIINNRLDDFIDVRKNQRNIMLGDALMQ